MVRRCASVLLPLLLVLPASASEHEPERLSLIPGANTIFTIEGHYPQDDDPCEHKKRKPLRAKYRGRLELTLAKDGTIEMVNALSFDNYLSGLAEVPTSWPAAALRAQVIAARS